MYLIHRLLESRHLLQLQLFLLLLGSTALLFGEVILFAMLLSTKSLVASGAYVITIFDTLLFWFFFAMLCATSIPNFFGNIWQYFWYKIF